MDALREIWLMFQNQPVDLQRIDFRLNDHDPNVSPQDRFTQTAAVRQGYNTVQYYQQVYQQQNPVARTLIRQLM